MSYGDEIMASGHAFSTHIRTGRRVRIHGRDGGQRWSDLWNGLDWIAAPEDPDDSTVSIDNGPGCRPYIAYPFTREDGCRYSGWRVRDHIGALNLTADEARFAAAAVGSGGRPIVLLEPNLAPEANPNKQWGWSRWQDLADRLAANHGFELVQVGPAGTPTLGGVRLIETPTFRQGAAVIERVTLSVLPEGGLHHAAGVLRRRAVVLFGGAVDVQATGYPWHRNLVDDGPESPCGAWTPCSHCDAAWARLMPEKVAAEAHVAIYGG